MPFFQEMYRTFLLTTTVLACYYAATTFVRWNWHWAMLNSLTPPPRIPQFITDTRHCWIQDRANRKWLEGLDGTKEALCRLESTVRPGGGGDAARTYPADLFRRLEVNNNRAGVMRGGWSNAASRLREILDCPAALQDVEIFHVEVYVSDGKYGHGIKERANPGSKLVRLFVDVLTAMPNLRRLEWETFGNGDEEFRKAFGDVTLPSVTHLQPAQHMHCLVGTCPNIEILEAFGSRYWRPGAGGDPMMALVRSTQGAKNLTSFAMVGEWELAHLEAVLQFMPNITRLGIGGELAARERYWSDRFGETLKSFATVLSQFPKLEELSLPASSDLGLGFSGGFGCGNAYFGRRGRQRRRALERKGALATEEAARLVLPNLPRLTSFHVGGRQANLYKKDDGSLDATWPWTGRMTNWTHEMWPDDPESSIPGMDDDYCDDSDQFDDDWHVNRTLTADEIDAIEREEKEELMKLMREMEL